MNKRVKREKQSVRYISSEERVQYIKEIDEKIPGFINENEKLKTVVLILTSLRVFYGIFYMYMMYLYGISVSQGMIILVSSIFFYLWYSWMLHSGKFIAVMMLLFRGAGIATGGAGLLSMSYWLPLPLIFTLTLSFVMEFVEAVFCIYVLFNQTAAQTIRLNQSLEAIFWKRKALNKQSFLEEDNQRNENDTE